jgi:hypothetical protein
MPASIRYMENIESTKIKMLVKIMDILAYSIFSIDLK